MTTGAQLADAGTADVLAADCAPHRSYARRVVEAVEYIGRYVGTFSAEDVREYIEVNHPDAVAHSPNVLPGAMRALAAERRIVPAGWTEATRPEARGRALRLWRTP